MELYAFSLFWQFGDSDIHIVNMVALYIEIVDHVKAGINLVDVCFCA